MSENLPEAKKEKALKIMEKEDERLKMFLEDVKKLNPLIEGFEDPGGFTNASDIREKLLKVVQSTTRRHRLLKEKIDDPIVVEFILKFYDEEDDAVT